MLRLFSQHFYHHSSLSFIYNFFFLDLNNFSLFQIKNKSKSLSNFKLFFIFISHFKIRFHFLNFKILSDFSFTFIIFILFIILISLTATQLCFIQSMNYLLKSFIFYHKKIIVLFYFISSKCFRCLTQT